jgi:Winged helix DNA-binding domain
VDLAKLRAWWFARQGLDGSWAGLLPETVLDRSGWARSVAGANPYLTLFSRAGNSRATADQAVAQTRIHELPAARGCTYVVPESDFSLALAVGEPFAEAGDILTAKRHLGVTEEELTKLCDAVLKALSTDHPMEPKEITAVIGELGRSLGPEGKKRGTSSTPPLALSRLQSQGLIRRVPVNGRLDQQRYGYVRWANSPGTNSDLSAEEALTELGRKFFRWIGPASIAHFAWFAGVSQKTAKQVLAPLELEPLEDLLLLPEDRQAWEAFSVPAEPQYALVASTDAILMHRREVRSLIDEVDWHRKMRSDTKFLEIGSLLELSNHAIFDRGRLIGLWEFDPEAQEIVYELFVPRNDVLQNEIERTQTFARDDLGDVRSFSLDSPASRKPKIAALREQSSARGL